MLEKVNIQDEEVNNFLKLSSSLLKDDFSEYAPQSFKRRLQHILAMYNMVNLEQLINKLKTDNGFKEKCINDILVTTTEFFRDPDIWLELKKHIIPRLKNQTSINIWHSGCSSGEEVYSMLILLNEHGLFDRTRIFATDLSSSALKKAKNGIYEFRLKNQYFESFDRVVKTNPLNYMERIDVPYEKYFDIDEKNKILTIKKFLRDKIIFRKSNLVDTEIFYKFDLIFCRNVIIYFNNELQNKIISLFYESLYNDGLLLIGAHESIGYIPIASKFKNIITRGFYQKVV